MHRTGPERLAMLAVATAGAAWGLYWIPLRALDAGGVTGLWAVVLFYLLPTAMLAPVMMLRWPQLRAGGWRLHAGGVLAGASLVFYAVALVYTDVVRALLFYYMTPIWSTFLARAVIGEAITRHRWITIALGVLGLLVILRADQGLGGAFNFGDLMGLASGVIWAGAAVVMNSDEDGSGIDFALSYFFWGSLIVLGLTVLPFPGDQTAPDWATVGAVLPWTIPVVAVLVIPPAFAVMWGATLLSPGLLAILFMTEISAGTITAALWAGEPFGLRELCGVLLITAAGLWEPVQSLRRRA